MQELDLSKRQYEAMEAFYSGNYDEILYGGGARGGKAQPLSAKILTPNGFTTMGEISVGDEVLTPDNKKEVVLQLHPQGKKKIYEIETYDGAKTRATGDHLWYSWFARHPTRAKTRTTEEILDIFNDKNRVNKSILIPLPKPLEFGEDYTDIPPYLIGFLLGDGGLTANRVSFTTADIEIVEYLKSLLPDFIITKNKSQYGYGITFNKWQQNPLLDKLREIGMMKRTEVKEIPEFIFNSSLNTRLGVIQGLMDSDGFVDTRGSCYFTSKSKKLAEGLQKLLWSIGCKATIYQTNKFCIYKGEKKEGIYWDLYIKSNSMYNLFMLKRKLDRVKPARINYSRKIKSIKFIGYEEAKCISISGNKHLYITDDYIVTHNSYIIGILLAIGVAAMPGSSWLVARTVLSELHSTTLSTFFTVLKQFGFGPKSYKDKIRDKKRIEFNNGSMIYVIQVGWEPSDPEFDRLGSHSFTGSFLDEAQQMVTKIRSVLTGRYSDTSADFYFETDYKEGMTPDFSTLGYSLKINIIGQAEFSKDDLKGDYIKIKKSGKYWLGITEEKTLFIPYKVVSTEVVGKKLRIQAVWNFTACSLLSCNPGKNFTYTDFWKPYAKGELPANRKFIRALVTDNPFVEKDYIKRLERGDDEVTKQRLLYGNFEYDDDPTLLFDSNSVYDMFKGPALEGSKVKYMTVDAARMGKDMTVIYIWEGFNVIEIKTIGKAKLTDTAEEINTLRNKYNIDLDNTIVDEVGVGGGLVDMIGCKGFIANSTPLQPISRKLLEYKRRNYQNLRTQCFFYLQRYIKEGKIKILNYDTSIKETISEELLFIKQDKIDDDKKICLQSKKEMKELLGRSPDYADALSFRMYWVVKGIAERGYEESEIIEDEEGNDITKFIEEWDKQINEEKEEFSLDIYD